MLFSALSTAELKNIYDKLEYYNNYKKLYVYVCLCIIVSKSDKTEPLYTYVRWPSKFIICA